MIKHFKYLKYLIRHKWFVFVAGIRVGAPLWRLIIHDWSKITPTEWFAYVNTFYGGYSYKDRPPHIVKAFDKAWLHHQHLNKHHWQFWILNNDDGTTKLLEMPDKFVREMVADWAGAGRGITGKWEVAEWYANNRYKMRLAVGTRIAVEYYLTLIFNYKQTESPIR